ncbi:SNF2-like protein [Penicillium crustosum]|nr:SNF2-like protein [Penicillium crustosum]KAJ5418794.1 SNF2-like protein [Penicillium crustosum]
MDVSRALRKLAFANLSTRLPASNQKFELGGQNTIQTLASKWRKAGRPNGLMHTSHLPPGKEWQMSDLRDPKLYLIALQLVYNRIRGVETLHLGTSIHIAYDEVSEEHQRRIGLDLGPDNQKDLDDEELKEKIRSRTIQPLPLDECQVLDIRHYNQKDLDEERFKAKSI